MQCRYDSDYLHEKRSSTRVGDLFSCRYLCISPALRAAPRGYRGKTPGPPPLISHRLASVTFFRADTCVYPPRLRAAPRGDTPFGPPGRGISRPKASEGCASVTFFRADTCVYPPRFALPPGDSLPVGPVAGPTGKFPRGFLSCRYCAWTYGKEGVA